MLRCRIPDVAEPVTYTGVLKMPIDLYTIDLLMTPSILFALL